jgi:hypothetical protein
MTAELVQGVGHEHWNSRTNDMTAKWYILGRDTKEICLITLTLDYQYLMSLKFVWLFCCWNMNRHELSIVHLFYVVKSNKQKRTKL